MCDTKVLAFFTVDPARFLSVLGRPPYWKCMHDGGLTEVVSNLQLYLETSWDVAVPQNLSGNVKY